MSGKLIAAILSFLFGALPLAGIAQTHDHSGNAAEKLHAGIHHQGRKWPGDDNLRQGMSRIRDALSAAGKRGSSGKMPEDRYHTLAQMVNEQVAFMIQTCKLDKEADAALHSILAELMAGADAIFGAGDERSRRLGVEKISRALEDYAVSFEHPGWSGTE